MAKVNETIGTVICPFTDKIAEVRKNKNGKLYFVGQAGMITPNLQDGQEWMKRNVTLHNVTPENQLTIESLESVEDVEEVEEKPLDKVKDDDGWGW